MPNTTKIIKIAKPLYHLVAIIAFLIVVSSALDLIAPILSKSIVDQIQANIIHQNGDLNRLILLIIIAFLANMSGAILAGVSDRLGDHFSGRLRKLLTEKFYDKVLSLPQSYFDSEISGKIINQLSRGITVIQGFVNIFSNFILPTILQSIFTIVVMAYYNMPTAVFTFLLFPLYLLISYYSSQKWGQEEVEKNRIEDVSRGRIQEAIGNIKVVKSFTNEKNEFSLISHNLDNINKIYARQSNFYHLYDFLRNLSLNLVLLAVNVVIVLGAFHQTITIGELVLLLQLINQARRPLFAMSFILTQVQNAESGSKEFFEVIDLQSTENYQEKISVQKIVNPTIEFRHVTFKYEKSEIILKDVSFKIGNYEQVALVGPSGVGKSTVVNLILKFYESSSGDILLSGKNYKNLSHQFVRQNVSLVFQENELFSSTIRDNVTYGTKANDEEIKKALEQANAWDFVQKLSSGVDSEIGERGIRLSGGQKQRIQIARAALKNAPILILDEATSSLDAKSEKEVQEALNNLMRNKLVIIIAHRFSTIQNVNKVIVLDNGELVDFATPNELAKKPGLYSELLHLQVEGNKKLLEKFEIY